MNPDLQKQIAEMLAKLMDVASDGAKWAGTQIPPLVQEKIAFGRAEETTWMVISAVMLIAGFVAAAKTWDWMRRDLTYGPTPLVTIGVVVPGVLMVGNNMHAFLLVWFAPRLYIVEWLRTLVR